jgi:predicted enzyme related to lactoylglutathione lyase
VKQKYKVHLYTLFLVLFVAACSTTQVVVPPVSSTPGSEYHAGKFVWYDLLTDDVAAAKRFYGGLFGWTFEAVDENDRVAYTLIKNQGKPIGGIIYFSGDEQVNESQWLSYLSVPNVDRATDYTMEAGGKVHRKPFDLLNRGRVSVVRDPQGAAMVYVRANGGDPRDSEPAVHEWLWTELYTNNLEKAADFYEKLLDYKVEPFDTGVQVPYYVFRAEGTERAGMLKIPWDNVSPAWLPYIKVNDTPALVAKVEGLGGSVLFAPREEARKGTVAIIADPSGAAVALQKWPME